MAQRLANSRSLLRVAGTSSIATNHRRLLTVINQNPQVPQGIRTVYESVGFQAYEPWHLIAFGSRAPESGYNLRQVSASRQGIGNGQIALNKAPFTPFMARNGDISNVSRSYANTFKPQRRSASTLSSGVEDLLVLVEASSDGIPQVRFNGITEQCIPKNPSAAIWGRQSLPRRFYGVGTMSRLSSSQNVQHLRRHTRSVSSTASGRLTDSGYHTQGLATNTGLLTAGKHYHSHSSGASSTGTPAAGTSTGFAPIGNGGNVATSGGAALTNWSASGAGVAAASTLSGQGDQHGRRRSSVSGLSFRTRAASLPPRTAALQHRQANPLSTHLNVGDIADFVGEAFGADARHDTVEQFFGRPPPRSGINGMAHYMKVPLTDLVRSYAILQLCSVVGKYPRVLEKATNIFTKVAPGFVQDIIYALAVKPTFFNHFCGGANLSETFQRSRQSLRQDGLGIILEYSVEADLSANSVKAADQAADMVKDQISQAIAAAQAESRTQPGARRIRSPERSAAHAPAAGLNDSMLAIKISALCPPAVLYRVSESYTSLMNSYHRLASKLRRQPTVEEAMTELSWLPWFECELKNVAQVCQRSQIAKTMPPETTPVYLLSLLKNPTRQIDHLDIENMFACYLLQFSGSAVEAAPKPFNIFSAEDQVAYQKMMGRVAKLCQEAKEEVPMLVDAEQTYFQPAITLVTSLLSSHFNRHYPTLWNTQQMYLKCGVPEVERYVEKAQREGWIPALKLVRGAYMVSERARAEKIGIPDPIHETLQDTHDAYNRALQFLLVNQSSDPYVMVASHNEESLKYAAGLLRQGVSASNRVGFAQLKGMCDSVTVDLAAQGLKTYKWVPYGPVRDAIPYLVRRIQENSTLLSSPAAQEDLRQMHESLMARVVGTSATRKAVHA